MKDQAHMNDAYYSKGIKHFWGNVVEFVGFHNPRPLDTQNLMRQIANDLSGQRLRYKDLVA